MGTWWCWELGSLLRLPRFTGGFSSAIYSMVDGGWTKHSRGWEGGCGQWKSAWISDQTFLCDNLLNFTPLLVVEYHALIGGAISFFGSSKEDLEKKRVSHACWIRACSSASHLFLHCLLTTFIVHYYQDFFLHPAPFTSSFHHPLQSR